MGTQPLAYPARRFEPTPLVDLSSRDERERLCRSALHVLHGDALADA